MGPEVRRSEPALTIPFRTAAERTCYGSSPLTDLSWRACLVSALAGCMHAQLSRLVTVTIAGFFNEM